MTFVCMPGDIARALVWEAQQESPNEMCGFVMSDWVHVPIPNCHPDPQRHFSMDEEAMLPLLQDAGHLVRGIYHSHPRGGREPSENDVAMMQNYTVHGYRFWIVTFNDVYEWRLHRDKPCPVRRDGTTAGPEGLAYPILASATPL